MGTTRSHAPMQGRLASCFVALLPTGVRTEPTEQILYAGGAACTVTIDNYVSGNDYVLVATVSSVDYTYSYTATATDTKKKIAYELMKLINAQTATTGLTAEMLYEASTDPVFQIHHASSTAFTAIANTGSDVATDVDLSAVASSASGAAIGATSITLLQAIRGTINAGQYLQFVEPDGDERLVRVSTTVSSGTTLSVVALNEAIAPGSKAIYPVELYDRTSADDSDSVNFSEFQTWSTGGQTDGVATGKSKEVSLGGIFYEGDAAYNTLQYALDNGREVYAILSDPPYKDDWTPRKVKGAATLSGKSKARPVDGFVSNDISLRFLGNYSEVAAAPIR